MPPAGYPAFLQYLQSGRVSKVELDRAVGMAGKGITATENGRLPPVLAHQLASARVFFSTTEDEARITHLHTRN